MTRYEKTFAKCRAENRAAFIPFWMIGDETPEASLKTIETMAKSADILELGMPFSDPLADGPTIQSSVNRALDSGTTTEDCFNVIAQVRHKFPEKPIGLLVYLNLIIAYGIEEFFAKCSETGVDSVLAPELPVEEVVLVQDIAKKYNVELVFLVSTNTPEDRLKEIYKVSGGFIYAVSTPSITGAKTEVSPDTLDMIKRLKAEAGLPICVGFGVSTPEQVSLLSKHQADGVIMGSRLFSFLGDNAALGSFCEECIGATAV